MNDEERKSTDKPLGDAGSGASGGGSFGNEPGPGAATGGDPKQGVRKPNAAEIEPANRRLDQHPHQTAEVPYGSGNRPEPSGKGGMEAQNPSSNDAGRK
ncbi:hypothetical protein BVER_05357 [Candidatus Burkholderia verschuerenii]|uniref:Uncharacterized protein n=1 Tax=Candidatus Burkholderia verschuerenii TaxID=242163 RepID=A0A0L0M3C3_9BURK|nr:hypothetical protein [Candidatus Burkholderia verschuerenii]KND56489.1 hypothetical protein BVER_05357 [Candidatus Burkholderia verschuerenii]